MRKLLDGCQMSKTIYHRISEITDLQIEIMRFVDLWVHEKKTIVPQKEVILQMSQRGVHYKGTVNALNGLMNKGYIRKAYNTGNRTSYVALRRI